MRDIIKLSLVMMSAIVVFGAISFVSTPITAETESSNKSANVDIKLFTFKPETLEVPVGTTVVWTNRDAIEHSVTNGTPEEPGGAFDSDFFTEGQTFPFTFTKAGEYPYFCKRHNSMTGMIKVVSKETSN